MPPTPFQAWLDIVRAERGWTLHDLARQLGICATTVFHYKEGAMLPGLATQQPSLSAWRSRCTRGTSLETALRDALRIEPRARR
jgi:transcriptional regulator with XRE-family HTH domain